MRWWIWFWNPVLEVNVPPSLCFLLQLKRLQKVFQVSHCLVFFLLQRRKNFWSAAGKSGQRLRIQRQHWKSFPTSAVWKDSCWEACLCMARKTSSLHLDWLVFLLQSCNKLMQQNQRLYLNYSANKSSLFTSYSYPWNNSVRDSDVPLASMEIKFCAHALLLFSRSPGTTAWCTSTATRAECGTPWWAAELKPSVWRLWRETWYSKEVSWPLNHLPNVDY